MQNSYNSSRKRRNRHLRNISHSNFQLLVILKASYWQKSVVPVCVLPSSSGWCMADWGWSGYYCITGWACQFDRPNEQRSYSRKRHVFTTSVGWCLYTAILVMLFRSGHRLCDVIRDRIMMLWTTVGIMTSVYMRVRFIPYSCNGPYSLFGVVCCIFCWSREFERALNVKVQRQQIFQNIYSCRRWQRWWSRSVHYHNENSKDAVIMKWALIT